MLFKQLIIFLLVLVNANFISSSKILGFFGAASRSHFIVHDSLMRGLAAKGHQVYIINIKSNQHFELIAVAYYQIINYLLILGNRN